MAKRRKVNKSQAIRDYLAKHPDATPTTIKEALKTKGVRVGDSLISQVKYSKTKAKAKARGRVRRGGQARKRARGVSMETLLAARDLAKRLGGVARAKEALSMLERLV